MQSHTQPSLLAPRREYAQDRPMAERFKRLRAALGPLGFLADLLTVATQNWGAILALALALGATVSRHAFAFLSDVHVQMFGSVFIWALWSYIGLSLLYRLHNGLTVSTRVDYKYAVIIDGLTIGINKEASAKDPAVQVTVNLRNVANGAIALQVLEFRLIISGRTYPPEEPMKTIVLPRIGPRSVTSRAFAREVLDDEALTVGHLDMILQYGPAEEAFERKYRVRLKLHIQTEPAGVVGEVESEEDLPI